MEQRREWSDEKDGEGDRINQGVRSYDVICVEVFFCNAATNTTPSASTPPLHYPYILIYLPAPLTTNQQNHPSIHLTIHPASYL